jgi:hypothetical protein
MKLTRTLGATAVIAISIAGFAVSGADADSREPEFSVPTVGEWVAENGVAAARALNPELTRADLVELSSDPTARMTESGFVLYVDPISQSGTPLAVGIPQNVTSIPLADFDALNSRPGSDRTIFIDFDGHTVPIGTTWDDPSQANPTVAGVYPAFTIDGDLAFSNAENKSSSTRGRPWRKIMRSSMSMSPPPIRVMPPSTALTWRISCSVRVHL